MRAKVLSVLTIESETLDSVSVDDATDVGEWLRVMAGPNGGPGEESFDLLVCTPRWLEHEVGRTGPRVGRHLLIVAEWNPIQIVEKVTGLFEGPSAKDWSELGPILGRLGYWEFEDYADARPSGHWMN